MKQDRRFGILLNCRTQIDKISKRICDTHHEVCLEEMEKIDELLAALHQFMQEKPVDDPLYPGGPPASIVEQICGVYDNDASTEDDSTDDEDLPTQSNHQTASFITSSEIDAKNPPQSNITSPYLEVPNPKISVGLPKQVDNTKTPTEHQLSSQPPRNKREKVKQPKAKTSTASRDKSGDTSKEEQIGGDTVSDLGLALKKPVSRKKISLKIPRDERSVLILERREMAGLPLSAHGQPRFIKIPYLDLVEGFEVMRDIFTLKARGGMEDKNDKTDCIIYNPKMPYVSKRYIRDLVIYLPTFVASKFAQGRKHYSAIQSPSSEELWAGMQCWTGWLNDGRIEVGTEKGVRRGCLFTAAFLHTPDEYLMGVLERVPKQKLKRKRGEYEEY